VRSGSFVSHPLHEPESKQNVIEPKQQPDVQECHFNMEVRDEGRRFQFGDMPNGWCRYGADPTQSADHRNCGST
jgi:hypothetical protein